MGRRCCVVMCDHDSYSCIMRCFPADSKRAEVWQMNIGRPNWKRTGSYAVCECHFDETQFEGGKQSMKRKLRPNAVPLIFPTHVLVVLDPNDDKEWHSSHSVQPQQDESNIPVVKEEQASPARDNEDAFNRPDEDSNMCDNFCSEKDLEAIEKMVSDSHETNYVDQELQNGPDKKPNDKAYSTTNKTFTGQTNSKSNKTVTGQTNSKMNGNAFGKTNKNVSGKTNKNVTGKPRRNVARKRIGNTSVKTNGSVSDKSTRNVTAKTNKKVDGKMTKDVSDKTNGTSFKTNVDINGKITENGKKIGEKTVQKVGTKRKADESPRLPTKLPRSREHEPLSRSLRSSQKLSSWKSPARHLRSSQRLKRGQKSPNKLPGPPDSQKRRDSLPDLSTNLSKPTASSKDVTTKPELSRYRVSSKNESAQTGLSKHPESFRDVSVQAELGKPPASKDVTAKTEVCKPVSKDVIVQTELLKSPVSSKCFSIETPAVPSPTTQVWNISIINDLETSGVLKDALSFLQFMLPQRWTAFPDNSGVHVALFSRTKAKAIQRSVFVPFGGGEVELYVHATPISNTHEILEGCKLECEPITQESVGDFVDTIVKIIEVFSSHEICCGVTETDYLEEWRNFDDCMLDCNLFGEEKYTQTVRSIDCAYLAPKGSERCESCDVL